LSPEIAGVMTTVTAVPNEVALPEMMMIPPSLTDPPVTLPLVTTVTPTPALEIVASEYIFSDTWVLYAVAASMSSDTFARSV
jgi:hypothetical protein